MIFDDPFPAYHELTKDEMWAAYLWELDREFLEDRDDPRLPWPLLWEREKEVLKLTLGKPILSEDAPPLAAEIASPPALRDAFRRACKITEKSETDLGSETWASTEDFWREASDGYGWQTVAFRIRPDAPLEDVCAAIKDELIKLRPFIAKTIPPKGAHWDSRLFDLLCLRLDRQGKTWKEAATITKLFRSKFGINQLDTKIWSTRRKRAREAIDERRCELEDLRKREMRASYESGLHGREMQENQKFWPPLCSYGAHGMAGGCFVGRQHPEKDLGLMAHFLQHLSPQKIREKLIIAAEGNFPPKG